MNILAEKTKDDVDKLTYHYLELSDTPKEEKTQEKHFTKSKLTDIYNTNNFYTSLLYPEGPFESNNNRNIAYDGGTFLTDKITLSSQQFKKTVEPIKEKEKEKANTNKIAFEANNNINNITIKNESLKGDIYSTGFESIPELKHSIPVNFDKLVVNLTDEPGKPKPINPLFFIINGEKPLDKAKFINFRTNPSLFSSLIQKKSKKLDKNGDEIYKAKKSMTESGFNTTSKTPKFKSCFNKACEDKSKLN